MAETCRQGACSGVLRSGVTVYFKDDFNGAFRWTQVADAGTTWTTRRAVSIEWQQSSREPERDHTATLDGMMAVCKDCPEGALMESPVIDTSVATGDVWVSLWSALNHHPSDSGGSSVATVSVFDGAKWLDVWATTYGHSSVEWTWHPLAVNVTKYKNKNFKVRIGFAPRMGPGAVPASSWFVDDVTVSNRPCAPADSAPGAGGSGSHQ